MTLEITRKIEARAVPCPPSTCILWTGCISKGYGVLWVNGQNRRVHRLVWEARFGSIPIGLCVCHRCDVPLCVNLDHLFLGSQAENRLDCVQKDRHAKGDRSGARLHPHTRPRGDRNPSRLYPERLVRGDRHWTRTNPEKLLRGDRHPSHTHPELTLKGERNGCSKLTDDMVRNIRTLWATGQYKQRDLAMKFRVTQTAIYYVVNGKTWKHVKP